MGNIRESSDHSWQSNRSVRDFGALAQLVERFHGMEEVRSSILLGSTIDFTLVLCLDLSYGYM